MIQPRIHRVSELVGWAFRLNGSYDISAGPLQAHILVCADPHGQFYCPVWEQAAATARKALETTRGPYATFATNREGIPYLKVISVEEARRLIRERSGNTRG